MTALPPDIAVAIERAEKIARETHKRARMARIDRTAAEYERSTEALVRLYEIPSHLAEAEARLETCRRATAALSSLLPAEGRR
jgi:hypothetical protein